MASPTQQVSRSLGAQPYVCMICFTFIYSQANVYVFVCIYPAHLHWRLGPFKTNPPGNTLHRSQGKEAFHSNGFEGMFRPRGSVESLKSPAGLLAERSGDPRSQLCTVGIFQLSRHRVRGQMLGELPTVIDLQQADESRHARQAHVSLAERSRYQSDFALWLGLQRCSRFLTNPTRVVRVRGFCEWVR